MQVNIVNIEFVLPFNSLSKPHYHHSESWTTPFQKNTNNHAVIITPHKEKTEIFVLIAGNSMPKYAAEWSWNTQQVSSRAQNRICQSRLYMLYLGITSFIL